MRAIVWFRQDLRIADNAALLHACTHCDEVIPVFIHDSNPQSISQIGAASNVWLHASLKRLAAELKDRGTRLILKQGNAIAVLEQLIVTTRATHLYWNRCYEPAIRARDEGIKKQLKALITVISFKGNVIFEPWEILKNDGTPYRVFTPYWNRFQTLEAEQSQPLDIPLDLKPMAIKLSSLSLDALALLPEKPIPDWYTSMMCSWEVGETAALQTLHRFLDTAVIDYAIQRDYPASHATSTLSPHLHAGEISPTQIFYEARQFSAMHHDQPSCTTSFLREVAWREFAYYLLYHFPHTLEQPLNQKFADFTWAQDYQQPLRQWQQGKTGFPIIDAGMRELWATGSMHNRIRMVVASFLTKNLLIPWQEGAAWFCDTLVDADLASNTMGWQWVAGSGADAAPYFRIFNPYRQSEKFDANGDYIRCWVPELSALDSRQIHQPSPEMATHCGYPLPIVDLKATRARALARYAQMKKE